MIKYIKKIHKRWKEGDLSQKSSMIMSLIVILMVIFIDSYWITESLCFRYRKNYRDKNIMYWKKVNNGELQYPQPQRSLNNDGVNAEWGITNENLHFFCNKNPSVLDVTPLIIGLMGLTIIITGGNSLVTGVKNLNLPTQNRGKIPDKHIYRAYLYMGCWIFLFLGMLVSKKFLTDWDSYTNTYIPIPVELVFTGFSVLLMALGGGQTFVKITAETKQVADETVSEMKKEIKDKIN